MTAGRRKALSATSGERNRSPGPPTTGTGSGENSNSSSLGSLTAASRKANKPLMEKRRRARINESLAVLKDMVVSETEKKTNASKLEKADILEMTVKHLKELCQVQATTQTLWRNGYKDCLEKTKEFLQQNGTGPAYQNLLEHLEVKYSCEDDPDEVMPSSTALLSPPSNAEEEESPYDYTTAPPPAEPINLSLCVEGSRDHSFVWRPW